VNLGETVDSRYLGSSPNRLFPSTGNSLFGWFFLARKAQNVRLAALNLEGDLRGGSGWSQAIISDFRESQVFSPKFTVLASPNVTLLCK